MRSRTMLVFFALVLVSAVIFQAACAEAMIANRTGTVKITKPDGTVLNVGKGEALPEMPSGSIIEIVDGGMFVSPKKGFYQIVAAGSVTTVGPGDMVKASIDRKTGKAVFSVSEGVIRVITGNTTTAVKMAQEVMIGLDRVTGVTTVQSVRGVIEVVSAGVKASVPRGAVAKISADAATRTVHIESGAGVIRVTSLDGKVIRLAKGEVIDTPCSAVGEIQTFAGEAEEVSLLLDEEPAEPERPEASEYR